MSWAQLLLWSVLLSFASWASILFGNIEFILFISALSYIECVWFINRALQFAVIIFSSAHAAQTAAQN